MRSTTTNTPTTPESLLWLSSTAYQISRNWRVHDTGRYARKGGLRWISWSLCLVSTRTLIAASVGCEITLRSVRVYTFMVWLPTRSIAPDGGMSVLLFQNLPLTCSPVLHKCPRWESANFADRTRCWKSCSVAAHAVAREAPVVVEHVIVTLTCHSSKSRFHLTATRRRLHPVRPICPARRTVRTRRSLYSTNSKQTKLNLSFLPALNAESVTTGANFAPTLNHDVLAVMRRRVPKG